MGNNITLDDEKFAASAQYWLKKMDGYVPNHNLIMTTARTYTFTEGSISLEFEGNNFEKLMQISQGKNLSILVLLLECYKILLYKLFSVEDIVISIPVNTQVENLNNDYVAIRDYVKEDMTVKDLLLMVKQSVVEAYQYQSYPIEKIFENGYKKTDSDGSGFLLVMDNLQGSDSDKHLESDFSNYLVINANRTDNSLILTFRYNEDMYDKDTMDAISNCFTCILKQMLSDINMKIGGIELIEDTEKGSMRGNYSPIPPEITLDELVEEQARKTPEHSALVYFPFTGEAETHFTYRSLSRKSNYLAKRIQEKGIGTGQIVGIFGGKTIETVLCIISVLKAGACYLILSPELPKVRLEYFIGDSQISMLLFTTADAPKLDYDGTLMQVDDHLKLPELIDRPLVKKEADRLAYMIYTSGSTGIPKGVLVEHRSICNTVIWRRSHYAFHKDDKVLQIASFSFDSSVEDLFTALASGASLVLIDDDKKLDMGYLSKALNGSSVTHLLATPSYYKLLLNHVSSNLKSLKSVTVAGENCSLELVKNHFAELPHVKLYNEYGPTENSVCSTCTQLYESDEEILIGKPINNVTCLVVNHEGNAVPAGIQGELFLSGVGLARGYLNNQAMTQAHFVNRSNEIFYRTGDRVVIKPCGSLFFIGRIDEQVKIHGYRIELGEIEASLKNCRPVKDAVVLVKPDSTGDKHLEAFITASDIASSSQIREYLSGFLPYYMIPSQIHQVEKFPLTINGKVDRNRLLQLEMDIERIVVTPENQLEEELVALWAEVLEKDQKEISVTENFFHIGGHSLKAVILIERIKEVFHTEIQIMDFFQHSTIKEVAMQIEQEDAVYYVHIPAAADKAYYSISSSQKRFFLQQNIEPENIAYNLPVIVEITGELDRVLLEKSLQKMIERHEGFRTSFHLENGIPVQKIHSSLHFTMQYDKQVQQSSEILIKDFIRPFFLDQAPLIRALLINIEQEDKHILCLDMHHIISDGTSLEIFIEELEMLYSGIEVPPLTVSYKDYAEWQHQADYEERIKKQENYWIHQLSEKMQPLNLPYDYTHSQVLSHAGAHLKFTIDASITSRLKKMAQREETTDFILLLAIYQLFLYKITDQERIILGSATAGRNHSDIQNVIGSFVNILTICTDIDRTLSFRHFLAGVRKQVYEVYQNQDYPFDSLVEKILTDRLSIRNPLFNTMFIYHNMKKARTSNSSLKINTFDYSFDQAQTDLKLQGALDNDCLEMEFVYATQLFKHSTIERFMGIFTNLISQVLNHPDQVLMEFSAVPEADKKWILKNGSGKTVDFPADQTYIQIFQNQASRFPERSAVVSNEERITYSELNLKSGQLSQYLRKRGLKRDQPCGILIHRSVSLVVGILAVMKAGRAFVPIDTSYPKERMKEIIKESNAGILLTDVDLADLPQGNYDVVDIRDMEIFKGEGQLDDEYPSGDNLAYIIFTSGSTGKTKGTLIQHKSLCNFIYGMRESISFHEQMKFLAVAPISFDLSISEVLLPLACGASVAIATSDEQSDPDLLEGLIRREQLDTLHMTPSRLKMLMDYFGNKRFLGGVQCLIVGGEELPEALVQEVKKVYKNKLYNMYGPTEATVWAMCKDMTKTDQVTLGRPLPNISTYIVNNQRQLQPVGVAGELAISGKSIGKGYIDSAETQKRFSLNPFLPNLNESIYYTGDMARLRDNGEIEFIGRADHQIKLRGYRIELGEIENCLLDTGEIKRAVVIAQKRSDGSDFLCAYFIGDRLFSKQEIIGRLENRLPDYMIPAAFVQLEEIPLTSNGKIDKNKLIEYFNPIKSDEPVIQPQNETEEILASIWSQVLNEKRISVNDNFFEVGGNSILLVQIFAKIKEQLLVQIRIADLFSYPTIRKMASLIIERQTEETARLNLYTIPFPEMFFLQDSEMADEIIVQYVISNSRYQSLVAVAHRETISIDSIILAAFLYAIHLITEQNSFSLYIKNKLMDKNLTGAISINFTEIFDTEKLFAFAMHAYNDSGHAEWYDLDLYKEGQIHKNNGELAILFAAEDNRNTNRLDIFDMILQLRGYNDGEVELTLKYNSSLLRPEKIKDFFQAYVSIIDLFIKNQEE